MTISMQEKRSLDSFLDIADQRILQFDWIRDTKDTRNQKVVVSNAIFPWWLSPYKEKKIIWFFFLDTDNQRILRSDWIRGKTGHNQPKELISHATSPGLSPCKNQTGQIFFPVISMIKESCNLIGWEIQLASPN